MAMSKLIKRKDGSYSKRGLWDNIRANAGSGKKPTKEMLKQEKKIKNLAEGGGIPERYKKMGFTHVGQKKEGDGQHKWKVLAKKGDSYKVVQGGYRGMKDFSQHHSEKRRGNFWNRMGGKNSAKANDPFSPLYWHKKLGKWEEGGKISHENDKEMVDGIADILQRVKDSNNRKEIANKMIGDFKKENVNYNRKEFLTKSNLPQYQGGGWLKELISNLNPFTWFDDKPQDYKTAFADARKRGLDKFTWNDKEYTTKLKEEPVKAVAKTEEPLPAGWQKFPDELLLWQAHKESGGFDPKVISGERVSSANAKGLTQIRPIALEEYHRLSKTPKGSIDLTNPEDAVKVQRYLMNEHYNSDAATKGNPTDLVRKAKALAFYNFGRVGTIDSLNKAKEEGHDIYTSLSWLDKLPLETSDYIKKILLHKIPSHNVKFHKDTTNSPYNQYYNFGTGGMLWFNKKGGLLKGQGGLKTSAEATYNPQTDTYDSRYSLPELTVTGKAPRDSFGTKITPQQLAFNQNIHNAQGKALGTLARFTIGGPQQAMMAGLTGNAQYPSEALGIKNPVGAIVTDMVTDPLVAGSLAKAGIKGLSSLRYKPAPGMMYRGIGEEGFKDAVESGVFRSKQNIATEYYPGTRLQMNKSFGTNPYFTPHFATAESYGSKYLAEVPRSAANWNRRYRPKEWSQIADRPIPITEGRILKKDWLRGYKPVEVPKPTSSFKSEIDWGKWNPETPNYPELINEYNTIEESTKKAGTWMKNPDGSAFQGTPEQFIQQQSTHFKKAFGNTKVLDKKGNPQINYHGGYKHDGVFFKPGDEGYGKMTRSDTYTGDYGIYFSPSKNVAKSYVNSKIGGPGVRMFKPKEVKKLWNEHTIYPVYLDIKQPLNKSIWKKWKDGADKIRNENYKTMIANESDGIIQKTLFGNTSVDQNVILKPTQVKSAVGNVGFFDMTNPNIYKTIVPPAAIIGAGVSQLPQQKEGGVIMDQRGQWAHPGKVTKIMGSDITMKGVPYPVFAESNKGQQVIMQPGQDYHFTGAKSVTEYPMATTHDYKISKYLLPQHKTGGTMDKLGNVPYDPADAHKKPLSNGLWALPFKKGGQIQIKPENKGKFTAWAKSHGMGVQQAASHVMANKGKYSSTVVKRANFAKNAAKWKHAFGGSIQALKMALGGKMETGGAFRPNRSSESGIMNFYENSSPKGRMFEGGDFPNSTFGDKTIEAKSYKMGGHIELKRPDSWVQASDAVQDLNKNPQQSWYGESNRAKATAPVFQGGIKKPLMANGGKLGFKSKSKFSK